MSESNFAKNIRIISLAEHSLEALDEKINMILAFVDMQPDIKGASVNQTYRTYESRAAKNAKSFINTVFFTNSVTIEFNNESLVTPEQIQKYMIIINQDLKDYDKKND